MLSEIEIKHACRLDRAMKVTQKYAEADGCIYDLITNCLHALSVYESDYGQNIKTALRYYHKESQEYRQQSQLANETLLDLISQDMSMLCREIDGESTCGTSDCFDACEKVLSELETWGEEWLLDSNPAEMGHELSEEGMIPKLICDVLHLIEYQIEQNQFPSLLSLGIPNTTAEILHLCIGVFLEEALGGNNIDQVVMERLHDNLVAFFEEMKSGISKDVLSQV